MKVVDLSLRELAIPFRHRFVHASAERSCTESVWVEARDAEGRTGHGEGCPRRYVTGEDLASARAFFGRHRAALLGEIAAPADLARHAARHRADVDANPAAWCAVELALLDLLGRVQGRSVESLLGLPELAGPFRYSAVLGDGPVERFREILAVYRAAGFRDFKVKLSGDPARDRAAMACFRDAPGERIRADANNLWSSPGDAIGHLSGLGRPLFAVEEPLAPGDLAGLSQVARALSTRIVLDEGALAAADVERLPAGVGWIVNLRVSKMGGLLRSLEVVAAARRRGIPLVVGAQVGETSVLTRAGLTAASAAGDLLVAQEGAFGTFLLERDVCDPPLAFGAGGLLPAPPPRPGLLPLL